MPELVADRGQCPSAAKVQLAYDDQAIATWAEPQSSVKSNGLETTYARRSKEPLWTQTRTAAALV